MEKKHTVLIVHNYYQIPGGEDTVVANERQLLEEHGHKVVLYTRHNSELQNLSVKQKLLLPLYTVFNPKTYRDIKRIIRDEKIDIVHVHNTLNMISPSVYYAAVACKIPVVQTIHNFRMLCPGATFYRDGKICEDCVEKGLLCAVKHKCYRGSRIQTLACVVSTLFHRCTGIYKKIHYICLTEFNKEKLLLLNQNKKRQIICPEKIHVKPNFTFDVPQTYAKEKKEYYLFIGRLEEIKGIDLLLQAFSELKECKLHIAGTGKNWDKYTAFASDNHMENVSFLGHVNREHLWNELAGAKAVIVTSQCYETFGMIIVEAYAASKPVIVGDIGNVGQLVEAGSTGLKFQYDSCEDLVRAVREFEKQDVSAWQTQAYRKFWEQFSPEANYGMLSQIYANVKV